eukprot:gene17074-biopygen6362
MAGEVVHFLRRIVHSPPRDGPCPPGNPPFAPGSDPVPLGMLNSRPGNGRPFIHDQSSWMFHACHAVESDRLFLFDADTGRCIVCDPKRGEAPYSHGSGELGNWLG